jgi:predicted ribosome quality control (RQC) complex YloA/Tae2 family protein
MDKWGVKMAIDGLFLYYLNNELKPNIIDKRVDKIFQPSSYEIVFHIGKSKLLVSANPDSPRIHFIETLPQNPKTPPVFTMLLRKYLVNHKITNIEQIQLERILKFTFSGYDELGEYSEKHLMVEVMGKHSNIIFVNPSSGNIIDSIKRVNKDMSSYREVLPGKVYKMPPPQDKINPFTIKSQGEFESIFSGPVENEKDIMKSLQGVGPNMAKEIFYGSNGDYNKIWSNLQRILHSSTEPIIYSYEDKTVAFSPFPLFIYNDLTQTGFTTLSAMIEAYFKGKWEYNRILQKKESLLKKCKGIIDKLETKKYRQEEELAQAGKAERYKVLGELITANLYRINPKDTKITVTNYYSHLMEDMEIELNPQLSPVENAQYYFRKYSKGKNIAKFLEPELKKTYNTLIYMTNIYGILSNNNDFSELQDIENELISNKLINITENTDTLEVKNITYLKYLSPDGFEIYVGKNNKQNDVLTFRMASGVDLWFHVKDAPGSHVIVRTNNKPVPVRTLELAANLAAYNSKTRHSSNVPVDYTFKKNVKKPKGAKDGYAIYDNHQTIFITPDPTEFERYQKRE